MRMGQIRAAVVRGRNKRQRRLASLGQPGVK